jgi:hypothetical protein
VERFAGLANELRVDRRHGDGLDLVSPKGEASLSMPTHRLDAGYKLPEQAPRKKNRANFSLDSFSESIETMFQSIRTIGAYRAEKPYAVLKRLGEASKSSGMLSV